MKFPDRSFALRRLPDLKKGPYVMISEKTFTEQDQRNLDSTPLEVEMACINEWTVRDEEAEPDQLVTIYVAPTSDGTMQTACSCSRGALELTCVHALAVIRKIQADYKLIDELFVQMFKRQNRGHDHTTKLERFA